MAVLGFETDSMGEPAQGASTAQESYAFGETLAYARARPVVTSYFEMGPCRHPDKNNGTTLNMRDVFYAAWNARWIQKVYAGVGGAYGTGLPKWPGAGYVMVACTCLDLLPPGVYTFLFTRSPDPSIVVNFNSDPAININPEDWPSIQILSSDGITQAPISAPNQFTGWAALPNGIVSQLLLADSPLITSNGPIETWQVFIDTRILLGPTIMFRPQLIMPLLGFWQTFSSGTPINPPYFLGLGSGLSPVTTTTYGGVGVESFDQDGYAAITTNQSGSLPMPTSLSNICFTGWSGGLNPSASPYARPVNTGDYIGFPSQWDYDASLDLTIPHN